MSLRELMEYEDLEFQQNEIYAAEDWHFVGPLSETEIEVELRRRKDWHKRNRSGWVDADIEASVHRYLRFEKELCIQRLIDHAEILGVCRYAGVARLSVADREHGTE